MCGGGLFSGNRMGIASTTPAATPTASNSLTATPQEQAYAQSQGYDLNRMLQAYSANPTGAYGAMTAHGGNLLQDYLSRHGLLDQGQVNAYGNASPYGDWNFASLNGNQGGSYGNWLTPGTAASSATGQYGAGHGWNPWTMGK